MMPILAHGVCKENAQQGFTLIELLLVLVLIGIALKMVVPNLAQSEHEALLKEGERLVQCLHYAQTHAVATGQTLAWEATLTGYRFLEFQQSAETWTPILDDAVLKARTLPESVTVLAAHTTTRIIFNATSLHHPFALALKNKNERLKITGNLIGQIQLGEFMP